MQDQSSLQSLLNGIGGAQSQANQVNDMIHNLQSTIQQFLVVGIAIWVVFTIYIIASAIHKWHVQSAILRIDKNLQKLVNAQVPVEAEEKGGSSDKEHKEQN